MSQAFLRVPYNEGALDGVIAKNSEVFKRGLPVTIDSSGFLAGCTSSGEKVHGYCLEDYTAASDNQTVAAYKPQVMDPKDVVMKFSTTGTLAQTDIGEYADVSTNTAGIVVLGNPGSTGQFELVAIDPDDSTSGYFRVAEPQQYAFAQS